MKVYVINLDRDRERLAYVKAEFDRVGVPFCRISGVTPTEIYPGFDNVGAVGCFQSHVKAWSELANMPTKSVCAIFEDDVHLADDIKQFLASDAWIPPDADIVHLETTFHSMRLSRPVHRTLKDITARRVLFNAWGTAGYVIRAEVAGWLVSAPGRFHMTPDHFLFDRQRSDIARLLRVYQLVPALCIQDKYASASSRKNFQSNLEYRETNGTGLLSKLRQAIRPVARLALRRQLVRFAGERQ